MADVSPTARIAGSSSPTEGLIDMSSAQHGKICYLVMPSRNPQRSARFYQTVFGWNVRTRGDGAVAFDDSTGPVPGPGRKSPRRVPARRLVASRSASRHPEPGASGRVMIKWHRSAGERGTGRLGDALRSRSVPVRPKAPIDPALGRRAPASSASATIGGYRDDMSPVSAATEDRARRRLAQQIRRR